MRPGYVGQVNSVFPDRDVGVTSRDNAGGHETAYRGQTSDGADVSRRQVRTAIVRGCGVGAGPEVGGPCGGLVGQGRMDTPAHQLDLHDRGVLFDLEEPQGESARPLARLFGRGGPPVHVRPLRVELLERGRQALEMAQWKRRKPSPDAEGSRALVSTMAERDAAADRPLERRVPP